MKAGDKFVPYGLFRGAFIPNVIMRNEKISANAKLLWARLAEYAGRDGRCFPSQEKLAEDLGLSSRYIRKLIDELIEYEFIAVEAPTGQDKFKHMSNSYVFLWHESFNAPPPPPEEQTFRSAEEQMFRSPEEQTFLLKTNNKDLIDNSPIPDGIEAGVITKHIEVYKTKLLSGKGNAQDIFRLFVMLCKDNGYNIAPEIKGQTYGYLKSIVSSVGRQRVADFFEYVIKNWKKFRQSCSDIKTDYPDLRMLYYNTNAAYDFYTKGLNTSSKSIEGKTKITIKGGKR